MKQALILVIATVNKAVALRILIPRTPCAKNSFNLGACRRMGRDATNATYITMQQGSWGSVMPPSGLNTYGRHAFSVMLPGNAGPQSGTLSGFYPGPDHRCRLFRTFA